MENSPISLDDIEREFGNTRNTLNSMDILNKGRVDSLRNSISELEQLIKERQSLSDSFIKEADKIKRDINNFLLESAPKGEDDSEFARERAELRRKQIELSELQLNERIGCWRDISVLKKELRQLAQELNEKEERAKIIKDLLEKDLN